MSRLTQWIFSALLCCFLFTSSTVSGQPKKNALNVKDPRLNQKVMVIKAGAELKTPTSTVWKGYLGEVFTVSLTNGEWLWIAERGGWLWEKDVIPFNESIKLLSERVTKEKNGENYHLRGVAYLAHGQFDNAIADFTESLRLKPRNAGALNNRGQASYSKGDFKSAVQDFTAAIVIEARNPLILNNRALAYIELDDSANAMTDLQAALALVPDYAEALNNRGIVHQKLEKVDDAIADFSKALEVDPKYSDALENRAFAYLQKEDHTKAIGDLESAMKLNPDSFEAANDLAWMLATSPDTTVRDTKRALTLAQRACELSKHQEWNALDTLAVVHAENGEFAEAKKWLEAALKLAPADEKTRIQKHLDLAIAQKPVRD
jgi:tetratricopeptide (TPR) repeat protein